MSFAQGTRNNYIPIEPKALAADFANSREFVKVNLRRLAVIKRQTGVSGLSFFVLLLLRLENRNAGYIVGSTIICVS